MRSPISGFIFSLTMVVAALSFAEPIPTTVPDGNQLTVSEWKVPWEGRPRDPFVDGKGRVWFCGQAGNYIAYLEPATGGFKRYELAEGTHPHNLIVGSEGSVWYAGNANAHIGKLDPDTGEIEKFPMPDGDVKDPHTLTFSPRGDIWFTAQWGNAIGFLSRADGIVKLIPVSTSKARPYGIKVSAAGVPWIVLLGTNRLATVDPQTFRLEEIVIPRRDARPRRLEISADGKVWYVDYRGGFLGRYDPQSSQFREWPLPGGSGSKPYGTALDKAQRIWIAETGSRTNRIVGFDTNKEQFLSGADIPSGGSIRHMYYHQPGDEFWFGVDTGFIGRGRIE